MGPASTVKKETFQIVRQVVITLISIDTQRRVVWVKGGYMCVRTWELPQRSDFFRTTATQVVWS